MKLDVCIDSLFGPQSDPVEGMRKVREAGFDAYEFWMWWTKDVAALVEAQQQLDLKPVSLCTRFVPLTTRETHEEYLEGLRETIKVAETLGCKTILSQAGPEIDGLTRKTQHNNLVEGLRRAAPLVADKGITIVLEPLNILVNHPGYFLSATAESFEVIDEVDSPSVKLIFDIYHQQITDGNLIDNITANLDKIAHFHAAGNPGRGTILAGEINYSAVFAAIDAAGYAGHIGLEYFPDPEDAISSLAAIRDQFPM